MTPASRPALAERFAVLMPVYQGDTAGQVDQALASLFEGQDLAPSQIVLVQDGPVGSDLAEALARWFAHPLVTPVILAANQGIAAALNKGLEACRYPIVARADADDVSLAGRFAHQVPLVAGGLDLVGGAMVEFTGQVRLDGIVRKFPLTQSEITGFARLHNPFAHPTVVFRAKTVRQAGGYPRLDGFEDYLLWARLLMGGAQVANSARLVVAYRTSAAAYARRGGPRVALNEVKLQRTLRAIGFTSRWQAWRNTVLRVGFELAPVSWRQRPLRRVLG